MTRSADVVLDAVHALDHPTADEVFDHIRPQVSRATVYRNLAHLVDTGRLRLRDIGDQKRYDPHVAPHVHVHDAATGRLIDVPMTPALQEALADAVAGVLDTQQDVIIEVTGRIRSTP